MSNYKGYFRSNNPTTGNTNGTLYCVYFIKDEDDDEYVEIKLAGENPFIVTYEKAKTVFDPLRTSTATINIVHNTYMEDIMTSIAKGTKIVLQNEDRNELVWTGYLKPTLYDANYVNEYETYELVANDYILTLQYLDYVDDSGYTKQVSTFENILKKICVEVGFEGFYWPDTKRNNNNTTILPYSLKISEQNFFSEDTDECWNKKDILEQLCKYLGLSAIQWKNSLFLVDYQSYHNSDTITMYHYPAVGSGGYTNYYGGTQRITAEEIAKSDATISFEPIYNKIKINCNFYDVPYFIPDIFNDDLLINRLRESNFYENLEYAPELPYKPSYPWGTSWFEQKWKTDGEGDNVHRYFLRPYDNRYWESLYYTPSGDWHHPTPVPYPNPTYVDLHSSLLLRNYGGATIVDMGVVKKNYYDEETGQYIVPNKLNYDRYICISQKAMGVFDDTNDIPVMRLKSGFRALAPFSANSFLVLNYSLLWEKYLNRPYINPDWTTDTIKAGGDATDAKADGAMFFKLKIGNKWWNGKQWTTTESHFKVITEKNEDKKGTCNEEVHVLNNISWDDEVNEEGYKIPLSGVSQCAEIQFEILFPSLQFYRYSEGIASYEWNAYCWVKSLSIKCVQGGQDKETEENDVVYENVIQEDAVNELDEIDLKITTSTNLTKPSYSNVMYEDGVLETITEPNLSNIPQKPEENLIERYVNFYNTKTKLIEMNVKNKYTPFDCFYGVDVNNSQQPFIQLGSEINYKDNSNKITFIQVK